VTLTHQLAEQLIALEQQAAQALDVSVTCRRR